MTFTDEQSFRLHVKNEPCARLYFLYGEENYLKKQYIDRLIHKAAPDAAAGFNYMLLDGRSESVDTICDAATALPLFAAQKCVYVSDFNAEQYGENDFTHLCELIEDIPDTTVMLFATLTQEIGGKKNLPARWRRFLKIAGQAGVVVELKSRGEQDLMRYARTYAEKQGAQLDGGAARLLCERCGCRLERLIN
ncbi:MAG: DNA polymerase III subunit delta, partial [Acetanaerobacterium sp.]